MVPKKEMERIILNHWNSVNMIRKRGGDAGGMMRLLTQIEALARDKGVALASFDGRDAVISGNWKNKYPPGSLEAAAFGHAVLFEHGKSEGKLQGANAFMVKNAAGKFVLSEKKIKQAVELAAKKYKEDNPLWEGWGDGETGRRLREEFEDEFRKGP